MDHARNGTTSDEVAEKIREDPNREARMIEQAVKDCLQLPFSSRTIRGFLRDSYPLIDVAKRETILITMRATVKTMALQVADKMNLDESRCPERQREVNVFARKLRTWQVPDWEDVGPQQRRMDSKPPSFREMREPAWRFDEVREKKSRDRDNGGNPEKKRKSPELIESMPTISFI